MFDPDSEKLQQAFMVLLLCAIMGCIVLTALFGGCSRFVNRGEAFQKGVFEKQDSIVWETKHVK